MIADHWGFVAAAYTIAALALGGYWRRLVRRDRQLSIARRAAPRRARGRNAPAPGRP